MVMKATGLSSSKEQPKKKAKEEKPKQEVPYRYKDSDGKWAWKLD